ncbi:MAG: hypothetical protein ACRDKL_04780 [Solirubrobacteraceae bacterium]
MTATITRRFVDRIDELLIGDFELIEDDSGIYADVDYDRGHPRRSEFGAASERRPCNAPAPRPLTTAGAHRRA